MAFQEETLGVYIGAFAGVLGQGFGDFGLQLVEQRVATADRLQVASFEVKEIGREGGEFEFAIRKLSLQVGKARLRVLRPRESTDCRAAAARDHSASMGKGVNSLPTARIRCCRSAAEQTDECAGREREDVFAGVQHPFARFRHWLIRGSGNPDHHGERDGA